MVLCYFIQNNLSFCQSKDSVALVLLLFLLINIWFFEKKPDKDIKEAKERAVAQAVIWFWCNVPTYAAHWAQCCTLIMQTHRPTITLLLILSSSLSLFVCLSLYSGHNPFAIVDNCFLYVYTHQELGTHFHRGGHMAKPSLVRRFDVNRTRLAASVVQPARVNIILTHLTIFCMHDVLFYYFAGWVFFSGRIYVYVYMCDKQRHALCLGVWTFFPSCFFFNFFFWFVCVVWSCRFRMLTIFVSLNFSHLIFQHKIKRLSLRMQAT